MKYVRRVIAQNGGLFTQMQPEHGSAAIMRAHFPMITRHLKGNISIA